MAYHQCMHCAFTPIRSIHLVHGGSIYLHDAPPSYPFILLTLPVVTSHLKLIQALKTNPNKLARLTSSPVPRSNTDRFSILRSAGSHRGRGASVQVQVRSGAIIGTAHYLGPEHEPACFEARYGNGSAKRLTSRQVRGRRVLQ